MHVSKNDVIDFTGRQSMMSEQKLIESISYDDFRPARDLVLERLREAILNRTLMSGDRIVSLKE